MPAIHEISDFDSLKTVCELGKPVVVKVYATWCGSCKAISPKFESDAEAAGESLTFAQMDFDNTQDIYEMFATTQAKRDQPDAEEPKVPEALLPTFYVLNGPKLVCFERGSPGLDRALAAAKELSS